MLFLHFIFILYFLMYNNCLGNDLTFSKIQKVQDATIKDDACIFGGPW